MMKRLLIFSLMTLLFLPIIAKAQGPILWQDIFEDDDLPALKNVGWVYYGPEDGLTGSVVEQRTGELFLQAGSYGGLVGAVIVETNGVPEIAYDANGDPTPETVAAVRKNTYSDSNQVLTFQLNFKKVTSSFFVVSTRMVFDSDSLDSDPTVSPAYALLVSPLEGKVGIAKYEGDLAVLDPTKWTYFGMGAFPFTMDVYYWVKLYLNQADMKVKVWEGEPTDEPEAWLLEGVDPTPRFGGTFTAFGLLNPFNPVAFDQMVLDNIAMRSAVEGVNPVTFKVNMSIQEAIGYFNPATDKVVIRGSFNGWAGDADELTLGATPSVYELTKNFAGSDVGVANEYKYVIMPGDKWETIANRSLTVLAGGQVLDVVYYDDRTSAGATANVTFQADMSDMLQLNFFNPATDQIRVTGAMNGWGDLEDWTTAQDLLDPSLFLLTKPLTYDAGTEIGWKFRAFPHETFLDGGWESGSNHTFIFNGSDMTLDKLKPAILPAGKDLTQDVTVRFTVNCTNAMDYYNKKPFPTIDGVYLNGDFVPLGAGGWGGWTVADTAGGALIKMYDDGATKGDAVAGDNIWTTEALFATGSKGTHLYKYGLYSKGYTDTLNAGNIPMDNEAGFSMNHAVVISDAAPVYVAPTDRFGSQWNTAVERVPSGSMPVEFVLQQNYPNPFNPITEIRYELPEKSQVSLAVYNTMGQLVKILAHGEQIAGSYRATWDATDANGQNVPSGIYFYRLQTNGFAKTLKMTLMK